MKIFINLGKIDRKVGGKEVGIIIEEL